MLQIVLELIFNFSRVFVESPIRSLAVHYFVLRL